MLACPLFREFCNLNKTAKLNGVFTGDQKLPVCWNYSTWFEFANIKGSKIIFILHHMQSHQLAFYSTTVSSTECG